MANQWQYIPDNVIDDGDRRKKAEEWAAAEKQRLADEWAAQQHAMFAEVVPTLEQHNAGRGFTPGASDIQGPGDAGIYPPMKEMLRRGVEDQRDALPRGIQRISSLATPLAEFIARGGERLGAAVRGEDWQSMPSGYDTNKSLEQNITDLRAGYEQRPEHFPGEKFITQTALDPTNVIPSGLLGRAGMQVVREGKPIAEAAGALSKYVPGMTAENVGGDAAKLVEDVAKPPNTISPYMPVKKEGLGMIWDRSRNVISRQGTAGKELADRLVKWREGAERQAGSWVHQIPTVRGLNKTEFNNFVDVAEAKSVPINAKVQQAFTEWADVRDQIADDAKMRGVLSGYRSDYFPHSWDPKDLQKLLGDKNQRLAVLQGMVKSGKAHTLEEAQKILYHIDEQIRTQKSSNLEMERILEDVPGWKRDLHSLLGYVEDAAKRISYADQFGVNHEKVNQLLVKITKSGHDAVAAEQAFKMAAGGGGHSNVVDAIRAANVFTKLGLGALTNVAQSVNTATVTGGLRTLMNTPRAAFSKEAKEFAVESGVTLDSTIAALREGGGIVTGMAKIGAPGFNNVERFNRTLAAVAGRDMARAALRKGDAKTLQSLGIDAQLVLSKGILSPQDEITAARNVVERTQFKVDPQDLPWWASTPLGKLVMQFRTFSYNQSAFMWREVIEPAIKDHNVKPLIRFMVYGGATGAALTEMQDFIKGRDTSGENLKDYISRYYQRVGGVGVLGDILAGLNPPGGSGYQSGERYAMQAVGTALGPSAGTAVEGIATVPGALQGDPSRLERFALKQVPVVGPPIANRAMPYGSSGNGSPRLTHPGRSAPSRSTARPKLAHPGR